MNKISAVIRLKDEGEWLDTCLQSIVDVFDEIILCTQGDQKDDTIDICQRWIKKTPNRIYHHHYEFNSRPNGPGHKKQPYDKFARSYFYNWSFAKASADNWKCKWDGDMIAIDGLKDQFQDAMSRNMAFKFYGIDLVGDIHHCGQRKYCASEIRLFREGEYINGDKSEMMKRISLRPRRVLECPDPLFFHTKWLKEEYSRTNAWPRNWKEINHFVHIAKRSIPHHKHNFTLPKYFTQ